MKINYKKLILIIVITFLVGSFFSFLIPDFKEYYESLIQPPLAPPPLVFPIVWSIIYLLISISLYIVTEKDTNNEYSYLIYGLQLIVNSLWTLLFFGLKLKVLSFLWILLLIYLVIKMMKDFFSKSVLAGWLLVTYLVWLLFAGYLNLSIIILNS